MIIGSNNPNIHLIEQKNLDSMNRPLKKETEEVIFKTFKRIFKNRERFTTLDFIDVVISGNYERLYQQIAQTKHGQLFFYIDLEQIKCPEIHFLKHRGVIKSNEALEFLYERHKDRPNTLKIVAYY